MGCVSSKPATLDSDQPTHLSKKGAATAVKATYSTHSVSLTSSTYGVLRLDNEGDDPIEGRRSSTLKRSPLISILRSRINAPPTDPPPPATPPPPPPPPPPEPEIINAWELMEDLEEEIPICSPIKKKTPKSRPPPLVVADSPMKAKRGFSGKENNPILHSNRGPIAAVPMKRPLTPMGVKGGTLERDFSPLFDPELIESFERELCKEQEQIKKMISSKPGKRKVFEGFEKRCPPGGEDAVVIYTTTLRGIRRTFEECNVVRSAIESHDVRTVERDVSMDSGFKEELRLLMGKNDVRVPMVFIKGWMIGGAEEVTKAEEAGRLEEMLEGIPRGPGWRCEGCGGMRFVMCFDCNGSCKVLDKEVKKMVKCGECNENGLIHCPICC